MSAKSSHEQVRDSELLRWMFGFLRPVRRRAALACAYLLLWIAAEILTVRQTAEAVNCIPIVAQRTAPTGAPSAPLDPSAGASSPTSPEQADQPIAAASPAERSRAFWAWLWSATPQTVALRRALLTLAGCCVVLGVLTYLREVANAKLSMHQVFHIRAAIYDQLQRVGLRFHDVRTSGELINRALSDLQKVRVFLQSAVLATLEIGVIVGGYFVLLLTRVPLAAVLALLPLPLWIWYTIRFSQRIRPIQRAEFRAGDRNIAILTENVAGVHVVKAFATEDLEVDKYSRNCDLCLKRVLKRIRMYAEYAPVVRGISMVSHLALFLLAGILIIRGVLRPGDILLLGSAMGAILGRLQQVAAINEQYQNAIVSARRLHDVLTAPPTVTPPASPRALPSGRGTVRFEHVTFGYDPSLPVLHDVSFEVAGGQTVALVGPTGAGKTTLVQLLARFYDPQQGRILIDGVDVRDVPLDQLRAHVAFVFQETYLFSDTIAANIAYSRPQLDAAAIEASARLAQAHEFIQTQPAGYQTVLGDRGASLSGGQRQRVAIARALCADPRILILDDATSAVDPETEEQIHVGLRAARHERTVFVIAHRLNTVRRAGVVLVLEGGRLTQTGTHAELLAAPGHYHEVAAAQFETGAPPAEQREPVSHIQRVSDPAHVDAARRAAALSSAAAREELREEAP